MAEPLLQAVDRPARAQPFHRMQVTQVVEAKAPEVEMTLC
jgi:hypothetical protein